MSLLFENTLAPLTSTIGFIRAEAGVAAQAYMDWMTPIQSKRRVQLADYPVKGSLETIVLKLLPLTSVERRRFLFVPTRGEWTAFFDNGFRGTDSFSALSYLAKTLHVRAGSVTAVPNEDIMRTGKARRYGATILELYEPEETEFLNYGRSISLSNDGSRWEFSASGKVQPFEDESRYQAKRVQDRFPLELLEQYLGALEFPAFDPNTYVASEVRPAHLVEKVGPIAPGTREFTLAEALMA